MDISSANESREVPCWLAIAARYSEIKSAEMSMTSHFPLPKIRTFWHNVVDWPLFKKHWQNFSALQRLVALPSPSRWFDWRWWTGAASLYKFNSFRRHATDSVVKSL